MDVPIKDYVYIWLTIAVYGTPTMIIICKKREPGCDKIHAWLHYITGLLNFIVLYKNTIAIILKHSNFWTSADVAPISNDQANAMLRQCMREPGWYKIHAWLLYIMGLLNFIVLYKNTIAIILKHSNFWTSADAAPMSNALVNAMPQQCMLALSMHTLLTLWVSQWMRPNCWVWLPHQKSFTLMTHLWWTSR